MRVGEDKERKRIFGFKRKEQFRLSLCLTKHNTMKTYGGT
jgi:hypothetical protein